jgi:2'-5' RNA ligase
VSGPTYHLWFEPTGEAHDILARTIREIAPELGGPVFEPHVSLIGNLDGTEEEIVDRTSELGRSLQPVTITLTEPSYRDEHFRCLFMLAKPDRNLMNAYAVASDRFRKPREDFMPHLSLAYGSASEAQKKSIIQELPREVRMTFEVATISLIRADSLAPKDWHGAGRFPMNSNQSR